MNRKRNTDQVLLYSCQNAVDEAHITRILGREPKKLKNPQIDFKVYKMLTKVDKKPQKIDLKYMFDTVKPQRVAAKKTETVDYSEQF